MGNVFTGALFVCALILAAAALTVNYQLKEAESLMDKLITQCEFHLPRDKSCKLTAIEVK